jgi:hypothetical protein
MSIKQYFSSDRRAAISDTLTRPYHVTTAMSVDLDVESTWFQVRSPESNISEYHHAEKADSPKPSSQLLLSTANAEIARWKPSNAKTLAILRSRSSFPKQNSWNHSDLAKLVVQLMKEDS